MGTARRAPHTLTQELSMTSDTVRTPESAAGVGCLACAGHAGRHHAADCPRVLANREARACEERREHARTARKPSLAPELVIERGGWYAQRCGKAVGPAEPNPASSVWRWRLDGREYDDFGVARPVGWCHEDTDLVARIPAPRQTRGRRIPRADLVRALAETKAQYARALRDLAAWDRDRSPAVDRRGRRGQGGGSRRG